MGGKLQSIISKRQPCVRHSERYCITNLQLRNNKYGTRTSRITISGSRNTLLLLLGPTLACFEQFLLSRRVKSRIAKPLKCEHGRSYRGPSFHNPGALSRVIPLLRNYERGNNRIKKAMLQIASHYFAHLHFLIWCWTQGPNSRSINAAQDAEAQIDPNQEHEELFLTTIMIYSLKRAKPMVQSANLAHRSLANCTSQCLNVQTSMPLGVSSV